MKDDANRAAVVAGSGALDGADWLAIGIFGMATDAGRWIV